MAYQETALQKPVSHISRYSGRPVATRADGKPVWMNREPKEPRK